MNLVERLRGANGPLVLDLGEEQRAVPRLELLEAAVTFPFALAVRFGGTLRTPLAELACLAPTALFEAGALLDFEGALLTPLVLRAGEARARRLLLSGPVVPAGQVLQSTALAGDRSARAVALAEELLRLAPGCGAEARLAFERAAFGLLLASPETREGIAAFIGKRAPRLTW
ncbi:MAG: hypothetical protein JNK60_05685 [Acidobacteria bacterium]|nr:hypothetical protein [Acidobacteriota bacterium]